MTKTKAKQCREHHAFDCQQYRLEQAERALAIIHTWAKVDADYIQKSLDGRVLGGIIDAKEVLAKFRHIEKMADKGLDENQ